MIKRALSVKDICETYGVSEGTVLGWIRSGELRAFNVGKSSNRKKPRWRIKPAALEDFEAASTPSPPPSRSRKRKADSSIVEFY